MDELLVTTGLDQPVPAHNEPILERVESIIKKSVEKRDAYIALEACKQLVEVAHLSGNALAKALYMIKVNWDKYDIDEPFENVAFAYIGLHKSTIERYISVHEMYVTKQIPSDLKDRIQQLNIKSQIPIAFALKQGYEIDRENWEELANAPDFSSVQQKIREIKGKEPRSGALVLMLEQDGTINVIYRGKTEFVGYLNVDSDNDAVQKAINRITKGAGILER